MQLEGNLAHIFLPYRYAYLRGAVSSAIKAGTWRTIGAGKLPLVTTELVYLPVSIGLQVY